MLSLKIIFLVNQLIITNHFRSGQRAFPWRRIVITDLPGWRFRIPDINLHRLLCSTPPESCHSATHCNYAFFTADIPLGEFNKQADGRPSIRNFKSSIGPDFFHVWISLCASDQRLWRYRRKTGGLQQTPTWSKCLKHALLIPMAFRKFQKIQISMTLQ